MSIKAFLFPFLFLILALLPKPTYLAWAEYNMNMSTPICAETPVTQLQKSTCEIEWTLHQCEAYFKEHPDQSDLARNCQIPEPSFQPLQAVKSCAKGVWDFLGGIDNKKLGEFLNHCAQSQECKIRLLLAAKGSADDSSLSEQEKNNLNPMTSGSDIYHLWTQATERQKMSQRQEEEEKARQVEKIRRQYGVGSEEYEQIMKEHYSNFGEDITRKDSFHPLLSVLEFILSLTEYASLEFYQDKWQKFKCVNSQAATEMVCYGIIQGLTLATAATAATAATTTVAKTSITLLKQNLGRKYPLAERIMADDAPRSTGLQQKSSPISRGLPPEEVTRLKNLTPQQRELEIKKILGPELATDRVMKAVDEAHLAGRGELGKDGKNLASLNNYTQAQLKEKVGILKRAGLPEEKINELIQKGYVGGGEDLVFVDFITGETLSAGEAAERARVRGGGQAATATVAKQSQKPPANNADVQPPSLPQLPQIRALNSEDIWSHKPDGKNRTPFFVDKNGLAWEIVNVGGVYFFQRIDKVDWNSVRKARPETEAVVREQIRLMKSTSSPPAGRTAGGEVTQNLFLEKLTRNSFISITMGDKTIVAVVAEVTKSSHGGSPTVRVVVLRPDSSGTVQKIEVNLLPTDLNSARMALPAEINEWTSNAEIFRAQQNRPQPSP